MPSPARVLIVANRTAATPALLAAVGERAGRGSARFHLVVPASPQGMHRVVDPEVAGREEAAARLEEALPLLREAADSEVTGEIGTADPLAAIMDALYRHGFDEIILSTLPRRFSRWLRVDLPSKARGLGLPVTHVEMPETAVQEEAALTR
jgi:hypothetical protein